MHNIRQIITRPALLIAVSFLTNSCKKIPKCKGDCFDLEIAGRIINRSTGNGIGGEKVEIRWYKNYYCWVCGDYSGQKTKTDGNGNFSFNLSVDSSLFRSYYVKVSTPVNNSYLSCPPEQVSTETTLERTFFSLNANALRNIRFQYYSRAHLTIRLHRTMNDTFRTFRASYACPFPYAIGPEWSIGTQAFAKDTTLNVITGANMYTAVNKFKVISQSPYRYSVQNDSILCTQTGPNIIDVNY